MKASIKITYNDSIQREIDKMDRNIEEMGWRPISDTSYMLAVSDIKKKYSWDTKTARMHGKVLYIKTTDS